MKRILIIAAVLVGAALTGAAVSVIASPTSPPAAHAQVAAKHPRTHRDMQHAQIAAQASTTVASFPVNARGQTYGSAMDASDPSQLPDLILVHADSGKIGYILKKDFEGPALTRQQVLALPTDANGNFVEPASTVPVYAQDGTTQIGTFTMEAARSVSTGPSPSS